MQEYPIYGLFKRKFSNLLEVFLEVLRAGRVRGEINCDLDDQVISSYILALTRGVIFEWKMQGKKGDIDKEISQIVAFLRCGLNLKN